MALLIKLRTLLFCVLLIALSSIGLGAAYDSHSENPVLAQLPKPNPNQSQFFGKVTAVDQMRMLVTLQTEVVTQPDGTELNFGTPQEHIFSLTFVTPVNHINTPQRWLSLSELSKGQQLVIYGKPNGNSVIADSVVVPFNDPKMPKPTFVTPSGLNPVEYDKVCLDPVTIPMIFPLAGKVNLSDSFLASRGGGSRRHHGQDLMAPKLTPAIACFDGTVFITLGKTGNAGNMITIEGNNGWTAQYYHINNDTPGTDDGKGTADYAIAPGLKNGQQVSAGQLIGWCGDSGNAEGTGPHVHFEIWNQFTGAVYNAYESLKAAKRLDKPTVFAPAPDLVIPKNQTRYEGVIRQLDHERNVIVIDLLASAKSGKPLESVTKPTRQFLRANEVSTFYVFGMSEPLTFNDLLVGDRITAISQATQPGKADNLTKIYALRMNPLQAAIAQQNQSQEQTQAPSEQLEKPNNGVILFGPQDDFLMALSKTVLDEINPLRAKKNLPPIQFDASLARACQTWTVNMVDGDFYDLRDSRTGKTLANLAEREGATHTLTGIICNVVSVKAIANEIITNYPDLVNNPKSVTIGIGHTYLDEDPGRITHQHYWAILIGKAD